MSYTIYKSDGTPVTITDNAVNQAFYNPSANGANKGVGQQLVGRNTIDYGQPIAQNFLQLAENFCGTVLPPDSVALQGQLWFNKLSTTNGFLYVRTTGNLSGGISNWSQILTQSASGNIPVVGGLRIPIINPTGTPLTGDLRVTTSPSLVIEVYGDGGWNTIFPGATVNPAVPGDGDIQVLSGPTRINMYAGGAWIPIYPSSGGAGSLTAVISSTTSQTAVAGNRYVITAAGVTTVTLPAAPAANALVGIVVANGLATNVVNPNGNTICDVAGNMTINNATGGFTLQFLNSSWRII